VKPFFLITILFSLVYTQQTKKLSIEIINYEEREWWSKYNNNGLDFRDINSSFFYKNKINNYNINVVSHVSKDKIILAESFLSYDFPKNYKFKIGKYYRDFSSYLNDEISSGSMLVSLNSSPLPKAGLLGSYKLKKNKTIQFNYGIAHAFLDKNDIYNKSPMVHEKFIYLIRKNKNSEFGFGLVHEAMWGGSTDEYGKFPNSFKDFLKVVISADGEKKEGQPHANALGNHLGIWDFYFIKNYEKRKLKLYYQHFFEDTSGLRFANNLDGLWGVEYSNVSHNINLLFEYLNTSNQDRDPPYVDDAYYTHSEYRLGWSYKGYVIGNPFIDNINYNPSKIVHIGLNSIESKRYKFKILFSKRIDINDSIKYSLNFGKRFNNKIISLFINGEKTNNAGLNIIYELK